MSDFFPLPALFSGMLDPEVEYARKLSGVKLKHPVMAVDNLDDVVQNYTNRARGGDHPLTSVYRDRYKNKTEGL